MTRDRLTAGGRLLFGEAWKNEISRALGPLHPDGARDAIDGRLVRRWAAGERAIPAWVENAIAELLAARGKDIAAWLESAP